MFNVKDKKNNQTSVSDTDREIPTLGKPCFRHYPCSLGLGFLGLHRGPIANNRFYLSINQMMVSLDILSLRFSYTKPVPDRLYGTYENLRLSSLVKRAPGLQKNYALFLNTLAYNRHNFDA